MVVTFMKDASHEKDSEEFMGALVELLSILVDSNALTEIYLHVIDSNFYTFIVGTPESNYHTNKE